MRSLSLLLVFSALLGLATSVQAAPDPTPEPSAFAAVVPIPKAPAPDVCLEEPTLSRLELFDLGYETALCHSSSFVIRPSSFTPIAHRPRLATLPGSAEHQLRPASPTRPTARAGPPASPSEI